MKSRAFVVSLLAGILASFYFAVGEPFIGWVVVLTGILLAVY